MVALEGDRETQRQVRKRCCICSYSTFYSVQVNAPFLDQGSPFSEMDFGMDTTNIAEEAKRLMRSLAGPEGSNGEAQRGEWSQWGLRLRGRGKEEEEREDIDPSWMLMKEVRISFSVTQGQQG